jgi:hypothetical protein
MLLIPLATAEIMYQHNTEPRLIAKQSSIEVQNKYGESLTFTDTTPYKIDLKSGTLEKKITYNPQTTTEGYGGLRYIETATLDGHTDQIKETFSKEPEYCFTRQYILTHQKDIYRYCGNDTKCIEPLALLNYPVCFWKKENVWKNFATIEQKTGKPFQVTRTPTGIVREGFSTMKEATFNDVIYSPRILYFNGTTNRTALHYFLTEDVNGRNCSVFNSTALINDTGIHLFNASNATLITSTCQWIFLTSSAPANNTKLNLSKTSPLSYQNDYYQSFQSVIYFYADYLGGYAPILYGDNVSMILYNTDIYSFDVYRGFSSFIKNYTRIQNSTWDIQQCTFAYHSSPADVITYAYPMAATMILSNATINDSTFKGILLATTTSTANNTHDGYTLMLNSEFGLPYPIYQTPANRIRFNNYQGPCFFIFDNTVPTHTFRNAEGYCSFTYTGTFAKLAVKCYDCALNLKSYVAGGFGSALAGWWAYYTQTYKMNYNMTVNISTQGGTYDATQTNYYGTDFSAAILTQNQSTNANRVYFTSITNVSDNSSRYMRFGEPNFILNTSSTHNGQWEIARIPSIIQYNPNSNYIMRLS